MNDTKIMTECQPFRKARTVNQTSATFVSKVPTNTEPSGDAGTATGASIIELGSGSAQNAALIAPYSVGADDTTYSMRIIGWRVVGANSPQTALWIPVVLAEVACVAGATVGVAGMTIVATERFADTITLTTGNDNVSIDRNSPADDTIAHVVVDVKGFAKLELSFSTGASATSCNALVSLF